MTNSKRVFIKTEELCDKCKYSAYKTCIVIDKCTSCPQYNNVSFETKTTKTHCKCNSIEYGMLCPYYKNTEDN